jgi:hypothetical protein
VEVIIKNTRFQYEHSLAALTESSDIYRADQERFRSQIAAITLAEMTLYIRNGKMTSKIGLCREHWKYRSKKRCRKSRISAAANRAASLLEF